MTNYEWLLKQNEELIKECLVRGVAIKNNGDIVGCGSINCSECTFNDSSVRCSELQREWLDAEHNIYSIPLDTPIDTKVLVSDDGMYWSRRHFAGFSGNNDCPYTTYDDGMTSWSARQRDVTNWEYCKLAEEGEQNECEAD